MVRKKRVAVLSSHMYIEKKVARRKEQ